MKRHINKQHTSSGNKICLSSNSNLASFFCNEINAIIDLLNDSYFCSKDESSKLSIIPNIGIIESESVYITTENQQSSEEGGSDE